MKRYVVVLTADSKYPPTKEDIEEVLSDLHMDAEVMFMADIPMDDGK